MKLIKGQQYTITLSYENGKRGAFDKTATYLGDQNNDHKEKMAMFQINGVNHRNGFKYPLTINPR